MQLLFRYHNDTGRTVKIHPATFTYGCIADLEEVKDGETCTFRGPKNNYAMVKMWDYGKRGLQILVMPIQLDEK